MHKLAIAAFAAAALLTISVSDASARTFHEDFHVGTLVTPPVIPGDERPTPNDWVVFEDKLVTTDGIGSIGSTMYVAHLEASIWGKLSPDGTRGNEWATVDLTLTSEHAEDLACSGWFHVVRYADDRYPDTSPVPYGESGKFRLSCDDGTTVTGGDLVGEFGTVDGVGTGFAVTLDGMARR